MAISASHENRFYSHAMAGLLEATKHRKSMESNFDRNRLREYDDVCDEQIGYAVELLKIGAECEYKDDKISILADNGDLIEFASNEIKERIGEADFYILFPPEKINEEESDPDLEMDDIDSDSYRKSQNNVIPLMEDLQKAMFFNPMAMMLPMLMNSMQENWDRNVGNAKSGFQGDPISAIQEQLEDLKEAKVRIKKKAIYYKEEYEKTKEQYEDLCRENAEIDQVANENQKRYSEEKYELEQKIESLQLKVQENEDSLLTKEQELESLKEQLSRDQYSGSEEKKVADEKIRSLVSEIGEARSMIDELNDTLNATKTELDMKNGELSSKNQQVMQKQDEVSRKAAELQQAKNQLSLWENKAKAAEEKADDLEKRFEELSMERDKLQQEKNSISEKLTNSEIQNNELLNKLNAAGNQDANRKRLENEINNLKNKNRDYERRANEADNARKKADENYEKVLAELESLKEENAILREAAYRDQKFEIGNMLSFQKRANNNEKNLKFVAMIDVCGMKDINQEYEEEIGDNVIKLTITALTKEFGSANVYRVRGAQFAVAYAEGVYGQIRRQLENVKNSLRNESEFDIVYGLASLERSSSRQDMVDQARNAMRQMKNKWDLSNKPKEDPAMQPVVQENKNLERQPLYQAESTVPYVTEMPDVPDIPDIQDSTPTNPNVAVNMLNDLYSDDAPVAEVDATTLNLAQQIMQGIEQSRN